jgi:predicted O-methyltransferase YrrM
MPRSWAAFAAAAILVAQPQPDASVRSLLAKMRQPDALTAADGQFLHDLVVRSKAQRVLEVGTSTGYSGIWLAMGLRKTGGKLISIEIHQGRHASARDNFAAAGLGDLADLRLADAVEETAKLPGPFDLILLDAAKGDYLHYYETLLPKLRAGGVIIAHDVRSRSADLAPFLDRIRTDSRVKTQFRQSSPQGLSLSFKR